MCPNPSTIRCLKIFDYSQNIWLALIYIKLTFLPLDASEYLAIRRYYAKQVDSNNFVKNPHKPGYTHAKYGVDILVYYIELNLFQQQ